MSKNRLKPALCCLLSATVFATSFSGLPLVTKTASAAEASATTEDVNEANGVAPPPFYLDNIAYNGVIKNINFGNTTFYPLGESSNAIEVFGVKFVGGSMLKTSWGSDSDGTQLLYETNSKGLAALKDYQKSLLIPKDVVKIETNLYKDTYTDSGSGQLKNAYVWPASMDEMKADPNREISSAYCQLKSTLTDLYFNASSDSSINTARFRSYAGYDTSASKHYNWMILKSSSSPYYSVQRNLVSSSSYGVIPCMSLNKQKIIGRIPVNLKTTPTFNAYSFSSTTTPVIYDVGSYKSDAVFTNSSGDSFKSVSPGSSITINYSGASLSSLNGGKNYIFAFLYNEQGKITYYSVVSEVTDVNGSFTMDIPGYLASGCKLGLCEVEKGTTSQSWYASTPMYFNIQNSCSITYDTATNGGSSVAPAAVTDVDPGSTFNTSSTVLSKPAEKPGYTFVGWNTDRNAHEGLSTLTVEEDTTLYAIFKKDVTVSFKGTDSVTSTLYNKETTAEVTLPELPAKSGWTPVGWTTGETWEANAIVGTTTTVTENTQFYGLYKKNVTIKVNGEDTQLTVLVNNKDESTQRCKYTLPTAPTKPNYDFDGWKLAGSDSLLEAGAEIELDGTKDVVAQFTPYGYWVTFDANGGTGTMERQKVTFDETTALKANEFEREGYTFAGWTHGSTEYSDKQSVTNLASAKDEEYKLTAKWSPIRYNVAFNANGGTGNMTNQSVEYDSEYSLNRCSFTKRGYNFVGWSTNRESTTADYNDEQANVNLTSRNGETVTLYAIWSTKSYTVTLDSNTATNHGTASVAVNFNSKLPDITIPTKEARVTLDSNGGDTVSIDPVSLTFAGYFKGSTKYYDSEGKGIVYTDDEDCTLTAKFSKKTVTLPEPTKRGWTFKGWAESSNASSGVMDYDVTGDVTLYATWAKEKHNVVYDATTNGGTTTASTVRLDFEERIDLTKTATKSGWEFVGWNTDANSTIGLTSLDMDVHDVKLYAIFKRVAKAVFKDCDGERTVSLDSFSGDSVSIDAPVARTNGSWVFRGWATDTTNTASPVNRVNAVAGGIVYYAVYEKDVALTCASENNTKRVEGKCYTNAADMSRVKPFTTTTLTAATAGTKEDWVLYGWGDGSDYLKKYDAGGAISITENTTIHGLYRRSVTLTFNTQGHVIPSKTVECLYNGDTTKAAQFTLGTPIREGYTFTTWELDGNMYSTGDILTLTSNSTINANWIANTYSIHFDPNGGAGDMLDQQLVYGTESALNSNEFRKVFNLEFDANGGKCSESDKQLASEFVGWTCNGETYADRATVKNLTKVNDATVTLKAKWKPITTELPEPTKAGYVFKGWYDGERNVKGSYDVTKDTKLKAVWEVQTTKVALKLDATDCSDYSIEVVTGEDMPRLKNFNKQYRVTLDYGDAKSKEVKIVEYTLNGLYSEPNGKGTKFYNSSGNSCHEWDDTCNTLYAHWTENSITLQDVDLTGYTFNGWYEGSSRVNRNYTPTKDVVLKAQLAAAKYRITWDLDGGTLSYAPTEYEYNKVVTLATPVKTGYTFSGWYLNGRRVTAIERGTSGDVRLTASWTKTTAATPSPTPVVTSKPTVTATATPKPDCILRIPEGTEFIPDGAYRGDQNINTVIFPSSLISIGKDAFNGCSNLRTLILPEGLLEIGDGAFRNCTNLVDIKLPATVQRIGDYAFAGCTKLSGITLPSSVISVGKGAFADCINLRYIIIANPSCDIWDGPGVFPQNTVIKGYYPSTASEYAKKYHYTFESLGVTHVMTLNTGNTAQVEFYYVAEDKLLPAKVNIPIHVSDSGIRFRGYALDTTTSDRKQAGSEGIKTLVYDEKGNLVYKVPFDLNKDISLSAVWEVYKVQSNESAYLKTGTKFTKGKLKYVVTGKGKVAVYGCTKTTSVSIPTSVTQKGKSYKITEVKAKAFKNNKTIKSITIGKNVVKIGSEAFRGCKNLGKISVKGKSLKSVGKNAAKDTKKRLKLVADRTVIKRYKKYFKQAGSNTLVI